MQNEIIILQPSTYGITYEYFKQVQNAVSNAQIPL